jgi:hypothetical protein
VNRSPDTEAGLEQWAMGHAGCSGVASHRAGVMRAFTSRPTQEMINSRNIQLVTYHDTWSF